MTSVQSFGYDSLTSTNRHEIVIQYQKNILMLNMQKKT